MATRKKRATFEEDLTSLPEEDQREIRLYMEYRHYRWEAQQKKEPFLDADAWRKQYHPEPIGD